MKHVSNIVEPIYAKYNAKNFPCAIGCISLGIDYILSEIMVKYNNNAFCYCFMSTSI